MLQKKFNSISFHTVLFLVSAMSYISVSAQIVAKRNRDFDVQHYVIRSSFNRAAKTMFGDTTIRLKPLTSTFGSIVLDAEGMQIEKVTLENDDKPLKFALTESKLNITLDKSYSPADEIAVRVKYKVVKPKSGVYFIAADSFGSYKRPAQIWTQGEAEENHFWFPSYDSPDDKATSEQYITTNDDETAVSNGKLLGVKKNGDKTQTFHYKMDMPHSTYLISFVIGKYKKVSDKYKDVPLNYYVYEGTESIVPRAFSKTAKMMEVYGKLLNYEFPYNKYDQTVVAKFQFGGMENITATTLADTEIYAAAASSNPSDAENLVSHELAHSWFGDLVTCKNWSNLWLNEGFATFMEAAFIETQYGREQYLKEMKTNASAYFVEEAVGIRHPLLNPRALPNITLFDSTTYKKGAFVINMLREQVGDEIFWKSLNNYLNKHKFQNVESKDLQTAFEQTSGQNLDWFFEQWVRKAGYPKLKVEPEYDATNKKLILKIKQTHKFDEQTPEVFRLFADVEIAEQNGNTKTVKLEMTQREQSFSFDVNSKPKKIVFDKREQILKKIDVSGISEIKNSQSAK